MGSFHQIYYHIVFSTKNRECVIPEGSCHELYGYIWGIMRNKKAKLYRINGTEDHLHIFCELPPSISLSDLVKNIKVASSIWMKGNGRFLMFKGWQEGYGAFTYSNKDKDKVLQYVKNQKEHHTRTICRRIQKVTD